MDLKKLGLSNDPTFYKVKVFESNIIGWYIIALLWHLERSSQYQVGHGYSVVSSIQLVLRSWLRP